MSLLHDLIELLLAGADSPADVRRRVAEAAGLADVRGGAGGSATGRDGALSVTLSPRPNQTGSHEIVVRGLLPGLTIARAGLGSRLWEAVGARDLEVGDPAFDADLELRAAPRLAALALLDSDTRALVRSVFRTRSVTLSSGTLSAPVVKSIFGPQPLTAEIVRALLALGHRLEAPADPEARLAAIAARDPLSAVRSKAIATLVEEAPAHAATREALLAGMRDVEPAIRLQAARALGPEGEPALHGLAADTTIDDAVSAAAVSALGPRFERSQARSVLSRAVGLGRLDTAVATLRILAADGAAELPVIIDVLALTHGRIAAASAEALGTIGAPAAEAVLLEALRRREPAVAIAAAHALGRCGTAAAVPDLKDAEDRVDLTRAARTAIAAIQSRLKGATPGQVSLTGGEAGRLSVPATDGRVSLPSESSD